MNFDERESARSSERLSEAHLRIPGSIGCRVVDLFVKSSLTNVVSAAIGGSLKRYALFVRKSLGAEVGGLFLAFGDGYRSILSRGVLGFDG